MDLVVDYVDRAVAVVVVLVASVVVAVVAVAVVVLPGNTGAAATRDVERQRAPRCMAERFLIPRISLCDGKKKKKRGKTGKKKKKREKTMAVRGKKDEI